MNMDFKTAVEIYKKEPTEKKVRDLADALLGEMTLSEKIHMLRGHAMGVTVKNFLTKGRFYNGEAYPAGGCKRLGIPPVMFTDGPRAEGPGVWGLEPRTGRSQMARNNNCFSFFKKKHLRSSFLRKRVTC